MKTPPLTAERACELLRRFTYKPGWRFEWSVLTPFHERMDVYPRMRPQTLMVLRSGYDVLRGEATYWAHDASRHRDAGELGSLRPVVDVDVRRRFSTAMSAREAAREAGLVDVHATIEIPMLEVREEAALLMRVHGWIRSIELHELDEWFKVDGKAVHDPHRDERVAYGGPDFPALPAPTPLPLPVPPMPETR